MKELNLTKDQKEKVQKIREEAKEKRKALRQEVKAAHEKMRELMQSDASKEELAKAFDAAQAKKSEVAKFMFSQMMQIREVLTKEQRAKLKGMKHGGPGMRNGSDDDDSDNE